MLFKERVRETERELRLESEDHRERIGRISWRSDFFLFHLCSTVAGRERQPLSGSFLPCNGVVDYEIIFKIQIPMEQEKKAI